MKWMLYGANGYTGRLIAALAAERGQSPILAGRNREAIEELGRTYSMDTRVFDLAEMKDKLGGVSAVLLAAGPFIHTSKLAVEACLARGVHYLDITGEIAVFEALQGLDQRARQANCVILPGVGFDVVPTDCLAATLAYEMTDATELELAFAGGSLSQGTTKTMLSQIHKGGAIRVDGTITTVPLGSHCKEIPFHDKSRHCVTIPWGDVSTAYYSTGIGNIRVYSAASPNSVRGMRAVRYVAPILATKFVQRQLGRWIEKKVRGPGPQERARRKTELWGQVRNAKGEVLSATLTAPEGYSLTAQCALEAVQRVGAAATGFQTPSKAFGAAFISEFPGVELRMGVQ